MAEPDGTAPAPPPRLSVGQWLTLLVVVLFLGPLFISNLWGYLQSRRYLTSAAFRNTGDLAELAAAETADFVRASTALVPTMVAADPTLTTHIRDAAGGDHAAEARAALHEHLRNASTGAGELDELQLLSPTGAVVATSREVAPGAPDLGAALCYQRGRTGPAVMGFATADGGPAQMLVAAPIDAGGAIAGVFCARFRFAVYARLLSTLDRRSAGADLYLLDEHGRVIAASEHGQVRSSGEPLPWLPRPPRAGAWSARATGPAGRALIVASSPVAATDWDIVVSVPVATTLADLETLKWQALGVFISLMAVTSLAVFLAWRTFVGPLRALAGTSERIADGATGATVATTGPREISELAIAFNRMSLALRDSQQLLEERIAARTRALRDSEAFLELLVNSIDQRVVVTDRALRIVKANAAAERLHGRALVGEPCYAAFEGRTTPCEGCPVERTFATGQPATAERSQHTVNGQEPVSIETYPVRDDAGTVQSVIAISRLISQEKHLQARMVFQEKMAAFGQLAAGMAHELGNPLAAVDAQLQRAERDPARAPASVTLVRKEVGRMSRMLRELVDFARRKRDEVRLASPNQVIEDVLRLLEHDPRARNVEFVRDLEAELPGVRLVEDHLVQVLLNLGLNALDAMSGSGTLTFRSRAVGGDVELRVSDTGTGVAESARPRLFEPFHTTKAAGRGTGLGLYVSRRVIEDMGGRLELEATGPTGSTFRIWLPPHRPAREAS